MASDHLAEDLPEYRDNPLIASLPPILSARQAVQALAAPPDFHENERKLAAHLRAHAIHRLGRYFQPLERHLELEARFSTLIRQGYIGRNPANGDLIRVLQDGHDRCVLKDINYAPRQVRSTATSFALIGCSGVGKSKSVERILELYPQVIHHSTPCSMDQVTWLKLDSPYQGSPKQLCINFFKEMDFTLHYRTDYLGKFGNSRRSVDDMMVQMSQVAHLHALGVLIIDEIQHLKKARGTGHEAMLNFLVTLVNTIGIPVIIIGTLGALPLLQGDFRQARRASGLIWERMEAGPSWNHFIDHLWQYQWLREPGPLTDDIRRVLYDESQGIIDVVVKLFMLGQLHALTLGLIRKRPETLDAELLRHVARENFRMIQPMINALKRGDRAAIAKYDDIRPLKDHVEQMFNHAIASMEGEKRIAPPLTDLPARPQADGAEAVRQALFALGVAPDIAEKLLASAVDQGGAEDPVMLMARLSTQLRPELVPCPAPASKRAARKKTVVLPPQDSLPAIVSRAMASGMNGYAALVAAGHIRPVSADLTA